MDRIEFRVPAVPPSLNHYKVRYRNGRTVVSKEAMAFKSAIGICGRGQFIEGKTFLVSLRITLGKGERGDIDNFPKLVMDGLASAGMFRNLKGVCVSDAYVRCLNVMLDCDARPQRGFTEIALEAL